MERKGVDNPLAWKLLDDIRRAGTSLESGTVSILVLLFIRYLEIKNNSEYLERVANSESSEDGFKEITTKSGNEFSKEFKGFLQGSVKDLRSLSYDVIIGVIRKIRGLESTEEVSAVFSSVLEQSSPRMYQHSPALNGILADILNAQSGNFYAPSFGFGDIIRKARKNRNDLKFHGNESNFSAYGMAMMGLIINGISGDFDLEYSLKIDPLKFVGKFDFVAVVPPFAVRYPSGFVNPEISKRYGKIQLGDAIWPLLVIDSLNEQGKGALVLPIGSTFSNRIELKEMRRKIVASGCLESIIALPAGMLSHTSISTVIYVFNKTKKSRDVLFIDGRSMASGSTIPRIPNSKQQEFADEIICAYRSRILDGQFSKIVPIEEIEAREFNLDPKTYILDLEEKESRKESIRESLAQIDQELRKQTAVIEKSEDPETISQSEIYIGRLGAEKDSMTMELVEIEEKRAKIGRENEEHKTLQSLKVKAFKMVIIVMSVEIVLTYAIFGLVGGGVLRFDEATLNIFIGATISQITAIFYWIIKHLFPGTER